MLLDTSGFLCLLNRSQALHEMAKAVFEGARLRLTHSYIAAELVALAEARGIHRAVNLDFARCLPNDPEFTFVWVDKVLHQDAVEFLHQRIDKAYSLCDAVSFVLMRRHGILDAFTTDRHFEQEGFVRLLV